MNKTVETIKSRLHQSFDDVASPADGVAAGVHDEIADSKNEAVSSPDPVDQMPEVVSEESAEGRVSPSPTAEITVLQSKPVKAEKKPAETKEANQTTYPYPKNWIPEGAIEMSKDSLTVIPDDRVVDVRKRNQEPSVITLPTTEKNVSESFSDVSVDPVAERISTVIAVNCTNTGDIRSKDGVMIQGVQQGNITIESDDLDPTGTIVVTKAGTVRGQIEGKRVVVLGRVEGSIKSYTHVTLGESAVVTGDVEYKTIRMMDGAEIEGNCRKLKDEA